MCASSTFYNGRVVVIGDSSIADDGTTGDPNDTSIYDGYTKDAGLNHQKLLRNAIVWLVENPLKTNDFEADQPSITIAPNPIANKELKVYIKNISSLVSEFTIYDAMGRQVKQVQLNENPSAEFQTINCEELQAGLYFGRLQTASFSKTIPFSVVN